MNGLIAALIALPVVLLLGGSIELTAKGLAWAAAFATLTAFIDLYVFAPFRLWSERRVTGPLKFHKSAELGLWQGEIHPAVYRSGPSWPIVVQNDPNSGVSVSDVRVTLLAQCLDSRHWARCGTGGLPLVPISGDGTVLHPGDTRMFPAIAIVSGGLPATGESEHIVIRPDESLREQYLAPRIKVGKAWFIVRLTGTNCPPMDAVYELSVDGSESSFRRVRTEEEPEIKSKVHASWLT